MNLVRTELFPVPGDPCLGRIQVKVSYVHSKLSCFSFRNISTVGEGYYLFSKSTRAKEEASKVLVVGPPQRVACTSFHVGGDSYLTAMLLHVVNKYLVF